MRTYCGRLGGRCGCCPATVYTCTGDRPDSVRSSIAATAFTHDSPLNAAAGFCMAFWRIGRLHARTSGHCSRGDWRVPRTIHPAPRVVTSTGPGHSWHARRPLAHDTARLILQNGGSADLVQLGYSGPRMPGAIARGGGAQIRLVAWSRPRLPQAEPTWPGLAKAFAALTTGFVVCI